MMTANLLSPPEPLLVLVDETDNTIGEKGKLAVHLDGDLHRAFSVFLFNSRGEVLLQQRSEIKYHSAGLWANACCGHPLLGEPPADAALARLQYEMGMSAPLTFNGNCRYFAPTGPAIFENEFIHFFTGVTDDLPQPNPEEVQAWRWLSIPDLFDWRRRAPEELAVWLRIYMDESTHIFPPPQ